MSTRKNSPYKDGELDIILSLVPTKANVERLSMLLDRSQKAIEIVYKIAYERGPFGEAAGIQKSKILAAKTRLGICIGPSKPRAERRQHDGARH